MARSPQIRSLVAVALLFGIAGCGLKQSMSAAGKSANTFHEKFNAQKFSEIYASSTPAFKSATKEADFVKLLQAIQRKLGKYKSATQTGWRGNTTPAGTVVVLTYNSQFEKHSAVETFTFAVSGETATLQGYNINSNALITE